jgi:hypothetical protein
MFCMQCGSEISANDRVPPLRLGRTGSAPGLGDRGTSANTGARLRQEGTIMIGWISSKAGGFFPTRTSTALFVLIKWGL